MFPISQNFRLSTEDYFPYLCSPKDLENSYARCRLAGVPAELSKPKVILPQAKLISRLAANTQLLTVIDRLITPICCSGPPKEHLFILCDPELIALKIYAGQDTLEAAEKVGVGPGTVFTEESCGTNTLSLAREHGDFVAIRGKQHYATLFENWWCAAGPEKDVKGKIIGYLNISIPLVSESDLAVDLLRILINAVEKDIRLPHHENKALPMSSPLPPEIGDKLTVREREVYNLLLCRLSSKEIASALNISVATVSTHRKNIYNKLGVNGLAGLLCKFS